MRDLFLYLILCTCIKCIKQAPSLKGTQGGGGIYPSVCPSVCLSVFNSIPLTNNVQYLKFRWSYSYKTWTNSSSKSCSHSPDITCPWGCDRVKLWDLEILPDFNFVAAGGIRVSQTNV